MVETNEQGRVDTMANEKAIWNELVEESKANEKPIEQSKVEISTIQEEPKVETPIELPNTDTPKLEITDEIRLSEINSMWGTQFGSLDEFKSKKAELDEIPTLKTKLEELSKNPPKRFASSTIEELNNFVAATGVEDTRISKELKRFEANTEKSPLDAMVLAEIVKKPTLIDDKDTLREYIQSKYNLNIDPDLEDEDLIKEQKRVKLVEFQMKQDAELAYNTINEISEKIKNYKEPEVVSSEQNKQRSEQAKAQWSETLNKVGKDIFKSHEIQVPWGKDKDGKEMFKTIETIELTPEQQSEAINSIVELASANNYELTNENLQSLINAKRELLTFNLGRESFHRFYANSLADEKLNWEKGIHNPSLNKIEIPAGGTRTETFEDKFSEAARKIFG